MLLAVLLVPPAKPIPITRAVRTAMVVESKPDECAENDPQQETFPKPDLMKAMTTATVMFLADLLLCFQAVSFFGENAFFFFLCQIHVFPP